MGNVLAILGEFLKLKSLAGVRTYLAAAGLLGLALSQFANGSYDAAVTSLCGALALVGIRAKLDDDKPQPPAA